MGRIKSAFAKTYDSFIKRPGLMPDGLLELIRSTNAKSVVDFACGTGNIAVGLSLEGFDATGVDYSPDMLKVARGKAREYEAKVILVQGDITNVDLKRKVDLVLCLGNTIPHFTGRRELTYLFKNCKLHLRPDGYIIFQQLNYDRMLKEGSGTFAVDIDGQVARFKQNRFIKGKAEFYVTIVDGRKIPSAVSSSKTILKPWLKAELMDSLKKAGFSGLKVFGSYGKEPFGPKSKDLILIGSFKGRLR